MLQCDAEKIAQFLFVRGVDGQRADGEFDAVFDEAIQPRPFHRGQHAAVHPQFLVALTLGPLGERSVEALARHDQRRQQRHFCPR